MPYNVSEIKLSHCVSNASVFTVPFLRYGLDLGCKFVLRSCSDNTRAGRLTQESLARYCEEMNSRLWLTGGL